MSLIPIRITTVSTGGEGLKDCYFENGPSAIEFYDKNPTVVGALDGDVRLNTNFSLVLKDDPGVIWKLKVTSITIDGTWSCTNAAAAAKEKADLLPGSGTFQAQASGTVPAEPLANSAAKGKAAV